METSQTSPKSEERLARPSGLAGRWLSEEYRVSLGQSALAPVLFSVRWEQPVGSVALE